MIRVRVTARGGVSIPAPALIGLSDDQARRRSHALRKVAGGFELTCGVMFKYGEEFSVSDIAKTAAASVEVISDDTQADEMPADAPAKRRGRPAKIQPE